MVGAQRAALPGRSFQELITASPERPTTPPEDEWQEEEVHSFGDGEHEDDEEEEEESSAAADDPWLETESESARYATEVPSMEATPHPLPQHAPPQLGAQWPPTAEQDEGGWGGRIAVERPQGLDPHLLVAKGGRPSARGNCLGASESSEEAPTVSLLGVRCQLAAATKSVRAAEANLTRAAEQEERQVPDLNAAASATKLARVREEMEEMRRELQRLRGLPRELSVLPGAQLHKLQEGISEALRRVQAELERRSHCCSCRTKDREVVLSPCMHLALCRSCASTAQSCPLCHGKIFSFAAVRLS
eukprot:TRINITY_DN101850_c0_g1_i1.p1 TRINITY_DN101850_c0_g1~~TRINITY_DN101850_c0_g1_i1.p1  ORF type:complete len:317 (-),score=69.36 TRINITY_DN101850_c0_g1_i1:52-963(-)